MKRPENSLKLLGPSLAIATLAVTTSTSLADRIEWPFSMGGNGHEYEVVLAPSGINWTDAKLAAEAAGGHLATVSDMDELDFINNLDFAGTSKGWIGGYQDTTASDYEEPYGGWRWVTGEAWSFVGWWEGAPSSSPTRNFVQLAYTQCQDEIDVDNEGEWFVIEYEDPTPLQWTTQEGGNGHWYAMVPTASPNCWEVDRDMAEAMGGHLATITSGAENSFISSLAGPMYPLSSGTCIGGYQDLEDPNYSEPGGAWKWVTGEPFDYTNWQGGEPGCCNPPEEENWLDFNPGNSQWRDRISCLDGDPGSEWAIVEWSADCNGDGIVDYGQILDGTLEDLDGNGLPDICYGVEWQVEAGGNGHWYDRVIFPSGTTWSEADLAAMNQGGHLVTLTSEEENEFVYDKLVITGTGNIGDWGPWIGARADGTSWSWSATGEPWSYEAWAINEPGSNEDNKAAGYWDHDGGIAQWADHFVDTELLSCIVEYSADCNGDGLVDFGQILDGSLEDLNGNGVPDACEALPELTLPYQTLENPDPDSNMIFADAVAVDGDHAVATARGYEGLIYFYKRTDGAWNIVDTAFLPVHTFNLPELFSSRTGIALVDDVAIVGAHYGGDGQGQARVYRRYGDSWELEQIIDSYGPSGYHGASFAHDLDYDGTTLMIGAFQEYVDGVVDAGVVHYYRFDGTQWMKFDQTASTSIATFGYYGRSVTVDGDFAAVTSNDNYNNRGIVELLKWNGSDWTTMQTLYPPDGVADDGFGHEIVLQDNYLVVGQHDSTVNGLNDAGCAWLYELNADGTAGDPTRITAPFPRENEAFATQLDMVDEALFISAGRPINEVMSIHEYTRTGDDIMLTRRFDSMELNVEEDFQPARSLGTDGRTLLVGLTGDGTGLVHAYDVCECDCPSDVDNDGVVSVTDVLVVLAEWGTSNPLGDANGDGIVDVNDILQVLGDWGMHCP